MFVYFSAIHMKECSTKRKKPLHLPFNVLVNSVKSTLSLVFPVPLQLFYFAPFEHSRHCILEDQNILSRIYYGYFMNLCIGSQKTKRKPEYNKENYYNTWFQQISG